MARTASLTRTTSETDISLTLSLDGSGRADIATGIGFLDHMLTALARHGLFDLTVRAKGDLHIDFHHTTEDVGIVLGQAFAKALGDKRGIRRFGHALVPMDETLAEAAVDISGRPFLVWDVAFERPKIGEMDTELFEEFFRAFAMNALVTLHITAAPAATRITSPRPASSPPRARCAWRRNSTRAPAMRSPRPRARCEVLDGAYPRRRRSGAGARGLQLGRAVLRPALARRCIAPGSPPSLTLARDDR